MVMFRVFQQSQTVASAMKMRSKNVLAINLHKWSYLQKMNSVWTKKVRLVAGLVLDCEVCTRQHITTPISHSAAVKVMAARVTHVSRVYVNVLDRFPCAQSWCARSWSTCSITGALNCESVPSIAQRGTPFFFFTFYSTLMARTYNKRKH